MPDDKASQLWIRLALLQIAGAAIGHFIWQRWMEYQELKDIEQATIDREFWEQIHAEFGRSAEPESASE